MSGFQFQPFNDTLSRCAVTLCHVNSCILSWTVRAVVEGGFTMMGKCLTCVRSQRCRCAMAGILVDTCRRRTEANTTFYVVPIITAFYGGVACSSGAREPDTRRILVWTLYLCRLKCASNAPRLILPDTRLCAVLSCQPGNIARVSRSRLTCKQFVKSSESRSCTRRKN